MVPFTRPYSIRSPFSGNVLAVCFGLGAVAQTLKASCHLSLETPGALAPQVFADSMNSCTADEVSVEVFTGGALASGPDAPVGVSSGQFEIAVVSSFGLESVVPAARVLSVPFVFNNRRHWAAAMEGPYFDALVESAETDANIRILGFLGGRQYGLASQSEVLSLDNLQGLNLRAPGRDRDILAFPGANPVAIPFGETRAALETGAVHQSRQWMDLHWIRQRDLIARIDAANYGPTADRDTALRLLAEYEQDFDETIDGNDENIAHIMRLFYFYSDLAKCVELGLCDAKTACTIFAGDIGKFYVLHAEFIKRWRAVSFERNFESVKAFGNKSCRAWRSSGYGLPADARMGRRFEQVSGLLVPMDP